MNVKDYISSGAIEAYVLGLANSNDVAEMDALRLQHPEINDAINAFEIELEEQALANAVQPPAHIKNNILSKIDFTGSDVKEEAPVVSLQSSNKKNNFMWLAAASIILLVISGGLNVYHYSKYKEVHNDYQALLVEKNAIYSDNNAIKASYDKTMAMLNDTAMKAIRMGDAGSHHGMLATVYWDTRTKDVYVLNNTLPAAPKGKQYQLWALVDGKPVDAGMLSDCKNFCTMKNIPAAQAFAITLEDEGGKPTPDMNQLFVLGNT